MLQALWSASSGMLAQQISMDNISNNVANVNTIGYKKNRTEFQDLLYSQVREPGMELRNGQVIENGLQVGSGVKTAATLMMFEQGVLQSTDNLTDFAISGNGFFEIIMPDGSKAYTRDGSFKVDGDGYLVTSQGYIVNMETEDGGLMTFTEGSGKINIGSNGTIYQDKELFQLEAYTFTGDGELEKLGSGLLRPTDKSGEAVLLSEIEVEEERIDDEGNLIASTEDQDYRTYYQVISSDGESAYTAQNTFKVDEEGRLVTLEGGYPLEPEVYIDLEAGEFSLQAGDVVSAGSDGIVRVPTEAGRLNIVQFTNPAGLEKSGSNLYIQTVNSGAAQQAADFKLSQGSLEMSNVQVAEEMVNMIMAQRAYEMSSRSIKTADEMLGTANTLFKR
ncbi:flagellar hook-basal body protein [Phosphitispora sp. TUW77]|uniref:flagellar hook-basal body protein n=1 Tax=Phosphitispora sp. TUW77 TaxID=3152361 RepID=UPI003AB55A7F